MDVLNCESVLQIYGVVLEKNYTMEEQMVALSTSFLLKDSVWNALYDWKRKTNFTDELLV